MLHTQVLLFLLSRKALFSYLINRITCLLRMAESSDELYFFFFKILLIYSIERD